MKTRGQVQRAHPQARRAHPWTATAAAAVGTRHVNSPKSSVIHLTDPI